MNRFSKNVFTFLICMFCFIPFLYAEENAYCQIGGENGITIGALRNVKLYARIISDGDIELYNNCNPFANDNCKPLTTKKDGITDGIACVDYFSGRSCYNGNVYKNDTEESKAIDFVTYFMLDKNSLKNNFSTSKSCPSVTVEVDKKTDSINVNNIFSINYILKFASSDVSDGSYEKSSTPKPVTQSEVIDDSKENEDSETNQEKFCTYGGSEGIKVDNSQIFLQVSLTAKFSNGEVNIYNNCLPGRSCENIALNTSKTETTCSSFTGGSCSNESNGQGYENISGKIRLDTESLSYFSNDICPSIKITNEEFRSLGQLVNEYFTIHFANPNTEGYLNSDNNSPVSRKQAQEEVNKNVESMINNLFPKPVISNKIGKCTDYLGSASKDGTTAHLIDKVFDLAKIGGILVTIVLSILDLIGTISKSKDELMDTVKKIAKRIGILLIIILLPTLIEIIGDIAGIEEILCGIK